MKPKIDFDLLFRALAESRTLHPCGGATYQIYQAAADELGEIGTEAERQLVERIVSKQLASVHQDPGIVVARDDGGHLGGIENDEARSGPDREPSGRPAVSERSCKNRKIAPLSARELRSESRDGGP